MPSNPPPRGSDGIASLSLCRAPCPVAGLPAFCLLSATCAGESMSDGVCFTTLSNTLAALSTPFFFSSVAPLLVRSFLDALRRACHSESNRVGFRLLCRRNAHRLVCPGWICYKNQKVSDSSVLFGFRLGCSSSRKLDAKI